MALYNDLHHKLCVPDPLANHALIDYVTRRWTTVWTTSLESDSVRKALAINIAFHAFLKYIDNAALKPLIT